MHEEENSSAPISGFTASRISLSKSVVTSDTGIPDPSTIKLFVWKLVSFIKLTTSKNEFKSCEVPICHSDNPG
ncbi:hypothetical protein ES703_86636 [subsurface metagenome]